MIEQNILTIEKRLGYTFRDRSLLIQAFTRPSYVNEKKETQIQSNQVLEFFGDSVLSCALVTLMEREFGERYQYGVKTKFNEGDFSVMKSHLSDKTNLSKTTATLGFGAYLLMGEGDKKTGVNEQPSVLEDLYESIIGAVWIDSAYQMEAVLRVVGNTLNIDELARDMVKPMQNPKNLLQEFCDNPKRRLGAPEYTVVKQEGPQHAPVYTVECRVGQFSARGEGTNTTKAEIVSANNLLALLEAQEMKSAPDGRSTPKTHPADTPASRLQRICDQKKISLKFTAPVLKTVDGTLTKTFTCTCICGEFTTVGEGGSKAEAKQEASRKMLEITGLC